MTIAFECNMGAQIPPQERIHECPSPARLRESHALCQGPRPRPIADSSSVSDLVAGVLRDVRARGDAAVRQYSREFDKADLDQFEVSAADRAAAVDELDPQTRADTEFAIENVRRFAEAQLSTILPLEVEPIPGLHLGHRVIPIDRVGAYVPGGRFPLLSAPIMTIVPGKVAGCAEVVACLPPNAHRAMIAGATSPARTAFSASAAQAIAAMALAPKACRRSTRSWAPATPS
jgi:histidinol dehydrogenase/sulfopropanediol 3-dehydrogenase